MVWKISGDFLGIRLDPGDELLESIGKAVTDSGIGSGFIVSFVGALRKARFTSIVPFEGGFKYAPFREVEGAIEIITGSGNIEPKEDGGVKVHVHAMFCIDDKEFTGGHLDDKGNIIGITAEIMVAMFPMTREAPKGSFAPIKFD